MQESDKDIKTITTTLKRKPTFSTKLIPLEILGVAKFAVNLTTNRLFVKTALENQMEISLICLL